MLKAILISCGVCLIAIASNSLAQVYDLKELGRVEYIAATVGRHVVVRTNGSAAFFLIATNLHFEEMVGKKIDQAFADEKLFPLDVQLFQAGFGLERLGGTANFRRYSGRCAVLDRDVLRLTIFEVVTCNGKFVVDVFGEVVSVSSKHFTLRVESQFVDSVHLLRKRLEEQNAKTPAGRDSH